MSIPARRVCTTIQRRAARSAPKLSRSLASHAHDHHHDDQPHPWTYPKETFTSKPFLITGVVSVLLLYLVETGALDVRGDKHPITRYMAKHIPTTESIMEDNLKVIEVVKEKAANYRLESSARPDTFKPSRSYTGAVFGSPHGLPVRPKPDMLERNPKKLPRQD